ncbi:unnamed protein product [Urochloa decumbens]|uniref:RING-type domain-containing protein n=1 Tax=Urochloa decumbens TaxID=240449 RepID=A0ABC9B6Z6_9POAL
MDSLPLILQGLIICAIVIAAFLACFDNTRNNNQGQQQADDQHHQLPAAHEMEEAVQIAMALLDRVTYQHRHCRQSTTDASAAARTTTVEEDCCSICLGPFEDGDRCSIMPLCRHEFHRACIADWLKAYNNTCPLCRAQLQWSAVADTMV